MAVPFTRVIRDQNLDIHYTGGKTDASKAQKKGGSFGVRKALNDISNSSKPSTLQASKNLTSIGKPSVSKASEKGKNGGRKALSDLTNTKKPNPQETAKKNLEKKFSDGIEEGFIHNHQDCVKSQRNNNTVDKDYFLKSVGLGESPFGRAFPPQKQRALSPVKDLEMEEMEFMEEQVVKGWSSPVFGSPISSPKHGVIWNDESFSNFALIESPKLLGR